MSKSRAVSFLISFIVFGITLQSGSGEERKKRQAPSINVHQIPKTSFSCVDRKIGEYYADPEVHCQVYHVCVPGMNNKMSLISFVCPNGTIFSQATRVCTPFERVDCSLTTKFYDNVNGQHDSARRDFEADTDYDNYVPPPPPRQPQPPARKPTNPPPTPREQPRNNRFRSGSNQFRGQQSTTTPAPVRATTPQAARAPAVAPARPAFRPPVARSPAVPNSLRPTARAVVSTSTSSYNYEYEYDYEYEDENPNAEQPNANANANTRSKRSVEYDSDNLEGKFPDTSFTCEGKLPGGAYADIESNCEMFHICVLLGKDKILDYKVSCGNGTAFDQEMGYCREKEEFVCENAQLFYQLQKQKQPQSTKKPVLGKKKYMKSTKTAIKE